MRKLLVLCMAGIMTLSLVACGSDKGDSSDKSEAKAEETTESSEPNHGWFSADFPEEFVLDENDFGAYRTDDGTERLFKIYAKSNTFGTAEETYKEDLEGDYYKDGGTVELGGRTWYVLKFDWNKGESCKVYADVDDNSYVEITFFEMSIDDEVVQTLLETFEPMETDNLYEDSISIDLK